MKEIGEHMKLSRVQITNFKSLRRVDVQLNDDINLLIGENNSGKSNLIEALRFLPNMIRGKVEHDDFENIISNRNTQNLLTYELVLVLSDEEKLQFLSHFDFSEKKRGEFSKYLESNMRYLIAFGNGERGIAMKDERICIYLKGKEIILSKGIWEANSYKYHILEDFEKIVRDVDSIRSNDFTGKKGGSSPARSILMYPNNKNPRPEEYLLKFILDLRFDTCTPVWAIKHLYGFFSFFV